MRGFVSVSVVTVLVLVLVLTSVGLGASSRVDDEARRFWAPVATSATGSTSAVTLSGRSVEEWAEIIDATWGAGAPVEEKLALFDAGFEEIWFSQEDVASGRDTVVAAALAWIREAVPE